MVVAADVAPLSSTNTNIVRSGESVQEVPKRPRTGGFGVNRCHYQNSASQSVSGNDRNCAKISVSDQRSAGWFVPSRSVGTPARHGVNRDGSRAAVVVAADVAPLSSTNTNIVRSGESVQEVPKRPRTGGFGVNRCHYQKQAKAFEAHRQYIRGAIWVGRRGAMTTAKNPEAKNEAKDFVFAFPKPDDWKNIVHDLKLTKIQERELEITVRHVLADIERYRAVERKSPPRDKLVAALKRLEKALRRLQYEIDSTANHMEYFLPHDTMEYIGWSLTFSAIGEALGTDVFPKNFDLQLQRMSSKGGPITLPSLEDLSQPMRRALGLKHGHVILAHFIDQVYAPLKKWVSLNKLNKGGRPAENIFRSFIIRRLAERSSLIVGRCATTTPKGKFAELCIAVLPACGWSSDGIEKAIEAVLGKMKGKKKKKKRKQKKAKEKSDGHNEKRLFNPRIRLQN